MIRVVLAVVLAIALLSVAMPAIEEGRATRTATHLDGVTDRIERAVYSLLAHEDPTRPGVGGARRLVRYRLPAGSWIATGVTLHVDGQRDRIGYRLDGHAPHWTTFSRTDLRTPNGTINVESPGHHRLTVSLVREDGVGIRLSPGRV